MSRYPAYNDFEVRKNSFKTSFPIKGITAKEFAKAGFYSIGVEDYTRCFFCGVGLRGWEDSDCPRKQHTKFSSSCEYLLKLKEEESIQSLSNRNINDKKSKNNSNTWKRKLLNEEIELQVQSRLDTPIIQYIIKNEEKFGLNKESIKKAIENQLKNFGDDFNSIENLIKAAVDLNNRI